MLGILRRFDVIAKVSRNVLSRTTTRQILLQLSKSRSYVGGYVNYNKIGFLNENLRTILLLSTRNISSDKSSTHPTEFELSCAQYERICNETLDSLSEYFEDLIEAAAHLSDADVVYGDGVLTIVFGHPYGTYVINRQTPNRQIWLSSPKSGPKRYDFRNGQWIYKHDGKTLHEILDNEIPVITKIQTCFNKCSFSGKEKQAVIDSPDKG